MDKEKYRGKIAVSSGYYNPFHAAGHGKLFEEAKKLVGPEGKLIIIVNNDEQVKLKGSAEFLTEDERLGVIRALKTVDFAVIAIDQDRTIARTLAMLRPDIFVKGGDVVTVQDLPAAEREVCEKYGIEIVAGLTPIGGSSTEIKSRLLKKQ